MISDDYFPRSPIPSAINGIKIKGGAIPTTPIVHPPSPIGTMTGNQLEISRQSLFAGTKMPGKMYSSSTLSSPQHTSKNEDTQEHKPKLEHHFEESYHGKDFLDETEKYIEKKIQEIEIREKSISEREEQLSKREAELSERETQLTSRISQTSERETYVAQLEEELMQRELAVQQKEIELQRGSQHIIERKDHESTSDFGKEDFGDRWEALLKTQREAMVELSILGKKKEGAWNPASTSSVQPDQFSSSSIFRTTINNNNTFSSKFSHLWSPSSRLHSDRNEPLDEEEEREEEIREEERREREEEERGLETSQDRHEERGISYFLSNPIVEKTPRIKREVEELRHLDEKMSEMRKRFSQSQTIIGSEDKFSRSFAPTSKPFVSTLSQSSIYSNNINTNQSLQSLQKDDQHHGQIESTVSSKSGILGSGNSISIETNVDLDRKRPLRDDLDIFATRDRPLSSQSTTVVYDRVSIPTRVISVPSSSSHSTKVTSGIPHKGEEEKKREGDEREERTKEKSEDVKKDITKDIESEAERQAIPKILRTPTPFIKTSKDKESGQIKSQTRFFRVALTTSHQDKLVWTRRERGKPSGVVSLSHIKKLFLGNASHRLSHVYDADSCPSSSVSVSGQTLLDVIEMSGVCDRCSDDNDASLKITLCTSQRMLHLTAPTKEIFVKWVKAIAQRLEVMVFCS
ncbi:hypothetical protein ADUPG1_000377 [Aduncisulcus paluster]|uniref:PH domain-containing protein n=1 Tax=Aduncisulcus paluster TaxID=2918883 RepID=A0ABQ5K980_9EUKA|nr:hypothetical protein ADUPG1_000377 [Aduncisulcus paluster]